MLLLGSLHLLLLWLSGSNLVHAETKEISANDISPPSPCFNCSLCSSCHTPPAYGQYAGPPPPPPDYMQYAAPPPPPPDYVQYGPPPPLSLTGCPPSTVVACCQYAPPPPYGELPYYNYPASCRPILPPGQGFISVGFAIFALLLFGLCF